MTYPTTRMRRLRAHPVMRELVTETRVHLSDLVAPLFVVPGSGVKKEIATLKGQYHFSVDLIGSKALDLYELGIKAVLLFGIPESKDEIGSAALRNDGIVQRAIREIKNKSPKTLIITDLCFCEYTSHGHCGIMKDGVLQNDASLSILVEQALSHADAGVDVIAPSGMLDGAVHSLRHGLDENSYSHVAIMSYAAKFASAFYGPFRDAVQSTPSFGDRHTHQMNPANRAEAVREVSLDINEGADIVMVKPALAYLDVIHEVKTKFQVPTAAYNVSGEYAMVKSAAERGLIDEHAVALEMLTCIKRAGADIIITYFAEQFAQRSS